jgi:ribose-phosphate pyrophosphokinase
MQIKLKQEYQNLNQKTEVFLMFDAEEKDMIIFTGNANPDLAKEIANYLGASLGDAVINRFNNGEVQVMINESVRGKHVFIIQPTCGPSVNDNVMELLIMADAFKRASAEHITAVVPYYGYARQDRKSRGREPITAKLMADLLMTSGVTRLVTMDLHAAQIQGFFDIPVDHMLGGPIVVDYLKEKGIEDLVVVSPDMGGVSRARTIAKKLGCGLAIVDKRRPEPGVAEVMNLIGDVKGKNAIMVDDMVDTAGSLTEAANALKKFGAKDIYACCTHAVLSGPAISRIENSVLKELIVTNTIPLPEDKKHPKIKVLTIAPILAETMLRINNNLSVSKLFTL